jgi:hypothetical protein
MHEYLRFLFYEFLPNALEVDTFNISYVFFLFLLEIFFYVIYFILFFILYQL